MPSEKPTPPQVYCNIMSGNAKSALATKDMEASSDVTTKQQKAVVSPSFYFYTYYL
jgi:hypothetical protein